MDIEFTKMHGLGNDFVVLDGMLTNIRLTPDQVRAIAHRRLGIGCDQVLLLERAPHADANATFRIFNADGNEVEQCGNGARCVADFLRRHGRMHDNAVTLHTAAGPVRVEHNGGNNYRANIGVPDFEPVRIPLRVPARRKTYQIDLPAGSLEFIALSLGNPHAVFPVEDIVRAPVEPVGAALQAHDLFPRGVNAGFMQIEDRRHIRLRVYERGAGETLACGSGACAAIVAGRMRGDLDEDVEVELPGGRLQISWAGEGEPVWMSGPAVTVYEGRISL